MTTMVAAEEAPPAGPNVDGLRAVVAQLSRRPDLWNQNVFEGNRPRGRARCFASWAVKLAGHDVRALLAESPDGRTLYQLARDILRLDDRQAWKLFLYAEDDEGRHPTIDEFKIRITAITGVTFNE